MPVMKCKSNNKQGWKFGKSGKCYTGKSGKSKAKKQGKAIEASKSYKK